MRADLVRRAAEARIVPGEVEELQATLTSCDPRALLALLSLEILFTPESASRTWLSVEYPTWLVLTASMPLVADRPMTLDEYHTALSAIDDHIERTQLVLMGTAVRESDPPKKVATLEDLGHIDPKTTARYAHIDTEGLARDPRLHLSFDASGAEIVELNDGAREAS